jgi:hypothetical protein
MLYPQVTEVTRAGIRFQHVVRGQRDLVALSLRRKPGGRTTKPVAARRGAFR